MRRHRRTRPRPVIPPAQRHRHDRPARLPAGSPPRALIDDLLAVPIEEAQKIWDCYLDRSTVRRPARLRDEEV
jgi:hypothetical protein